MKRKKLPTNEPSTVRPSAEQLRADGNWFMGTGAGLGAFSVASGVLFGAVCPVCIVATPALVGAGVYKRICARRSSRKKESILGSRPATSHR